MNEYQYTIKRNNYEPVIINIPVLLYFVFHVKKNSKNKKSFMGD